MEKPTQNQIQKVIRDLEQCFEEIEDKQGKKETKAQLSILKGRLVSPEIYKKDGALVYRAALAAKLYIDGKVHESELY